MGCIWQTGVHMFFFKHSDVNVLSLSKQIFGFQLGTPKVIQTYGDALESINAIPDDESENEIQDVRHLLQLFQRKTEKSQIAGYKSRENLSCFWY